MDLKFNFDKVTIIEYKEMILRTIIDTEPEVTKRVKCRTKGCITLLRQDKIRKRQRYCEVCRRKRMWERFHREWGEGI